MVYRFNYPADCQQLPLIKNDQNDEVESLSHYFSHEANDLLDIIKSAKSETHLMNCPISFVKLKCHSSYRHDSIGSSFVFALYRFVHGQLFVLRTNRDRQTVAIRLASRANRGNSRSASCRGYRLRDTGRVSSSVECRLRSNRATGRDEKTARIIRRKAHLVALMH